MNEQVILLSVLSFSLPKQLIIRMIDSVIGSEKGKIKECLLCQRILQDLLPLNSDYECHTAKMMEKIPSVLHLQMYKVIFKAPIYFDLSIF